jgi:hypothetical protein
MRNESIVTCKELTGKRGQAAHALQENRLLESLRGTPDLNRLLRIRVSAGHRAAKADDTFMSDHAAFDVPALWHRDHERYDAGFREPYRFDSLSRSQHNIFAPEFYRLHPVAQFP